MGSGRKSAWCPVGSRRCGWNHRNPSHHTGVRSRNRFGNRPAPGGGRFGCARRRLYVRLLLLRGAAPDALRHSVPSRNGRGIRNRRPAPSSGSPRDRISLPALGSECCCWPLYGRGSDVYRLYLFRIRARTGPGKHRYCYFASGTGGCGAACGGRTRRTPVSSRLRRNRADLRFARAFHLHRQKIRI